MSLAPMPLQPRHPHLRSRRRPGLITEDPLAADALRWG